MFFPWQHLDGIHSWELSFHKKLRWTHQLPPEQSLGWFHVPPSLLLLTVYFTITGKGKEAGRNFSWVLVGPTQWMDMGARVRKLWLTVNYGWGTVQNVLLTRWSSRKNYINSNQWIHLKARTLRIHGACTLSLWERRTPGRNSLGSFLKTKDDNETRCIFLL